jgi:multidrug efflux system outer membrane protein
VSRHQTLGASMATRRRAGLVAATSVAVLFATTLSGCTTVGLNFERPKPSLPAGWSATPSPAAASRTGTEPLTDATWWAAFGDPTLTSLIERAASANLDLKAASLRIAEARDQRAIVATGAWPAANASAAWQGQRLSENTPTGRLFSLVGDIPGLPPGAAMSNPSGQYMLGFDAVWEVDLFGRVRRSVQAADAEVAATVEERHGAEVSLQAEIARAYIDLRGAQLRRAVAVESLATARDLLHVARDRRRLGLSTEIDVARASAQASLIDAQLPVLEAQITADINALSRLIDREPGALASELTAARPVPLAPPEVAVGLPAALMCRRPDIRGAEAQWRAAVARQGVAVADRYPRLTLSAAGGYQAQDIGSLLNWASRFGVIGPQLNAPIFDAGRRRTRVELEGYRAQEAAVGYARTVLVALHEVDGALTAYGQEQARRATLGQAVEQDRAAARLTRLRYQNGVDSILSVLDAERTLHQDQSLLADSTTAVSLRLVALYKALGGSWDGSHAACGA